MRFLGYVIRMSCVTCLAELFVTYVIYPIEAGSPFAFMQVLLGLVFTSFQHCPLA